MTMFNDRPAGGQTSGKWTAKRITSLVLGLIVVNAAGFLIRGSGNSCTSWMTSAYDRAIALDLYGDKKGAVDAYSEDLKWHPKNVEALKGRGNAYADLGQYDLAVADFTRALQLEPRQWLIIEDRARVYEKLGKLDLAIADMTQAAQVAPDIWSNWKVRGDLYLEQGNLDAAIADYTRSLDVDSKVDEGLYPRGIAYLRAGKFDLAKADFSAYADAHFNYASAVQGRDCAALGSNSGDCAIPYPPPPDPETDMLMRAAGRSLSGCDQS
jgi:tetratricopeptide (TPR) repeat protein